MPRRNAVKDSLLEAGVVAETDSCFPLLVDQVEHALFPPEHERYVPDYGCIITSELAAHGSAMDVRNVPLSIAQQMADGISTFLVFLGDAHYQVVQYAASHDEERHLIKLARRWNGIVVHRATPNTVRVITRTGIYLQKSGGWQARPYSRSVLPAVRDVVPQGSKRVLKHILDFGFHVLSPSRVGSTLVWWLQPPPTSPRGGQDVSQAGINITNSRHFAALRSLLRQHDGAAFISAKGIVESIGHHLQYSSRAIEIIPQSGGTRHTSAQRFSFDEPRVLVVVVSEEGPVSVFSDGVKVTELLQKPVGVQQEQVAGSEPAKPDDMLTEKRFVECPRCGKTVFVEVFTSLGWKEEGAGQCPVCGETVTSPTCFNVWTRLRKRLPQKDVR